MSSAHRLVCLAVIVCLSLLVMPAAASAATSVVLWSRVFGASDYSPLFDAACDNSGNVYVAGVKYTPTSSTNHGLAVLRKYTSGGGNLIWARQFGGNVAQNSARSVAVDKYGRCYVGGQWSTSASQKAYLRAYTASGGVRWTRLWTATDGVRAVAVSPSGANVYAASDVGDEDIIVRRYSSGGTLRRWVRLQTNGRMPTGDITVDPSGNVYACGTAGRGNAEGSCYVKKMSPALSTLWTRTWHLWNGQGFTRVVADATGAWLTGWVESAPDTTTPIGGVFVKYTAAGGLSSAMSASETVDGRSGLAKDASSLYVVDGCGAVPPDTTTTARHWKTYKYDRTWSPQDSWTAGPTNKTSYPEGCATDRFGNLIVVGTQDGRSAVMKYKK